MRIPSRTLAAREGFTLVEVLVAMAVLMIGVLATLAIVDRSNARTLSTRSHEAAVNVARELVEAARSVPYPTLTPASIEGEIQDQPGLADDGAPAGWTIRRRGFTFTASATVCSFDDARDGGGNHSAGSFCADSAVPTSPPDNTPEDYRRVRVEVRWNDRGADREVHQTLLINNPGSAGAPAVRTLDLSSGATVSPADHVTAATTLGFTLTTSSQPKTLHWLLDGASQEPITSGSGLSWSFAWPLGQPGVAGSVVDGTYVVSAEAFDAYDVAGPSRSVTVTLNRSLPDKVTGVGGGRTGDPDRPQDQVVDLEWLPSLQRDIVGYSVERTDSSGTVEVCARKERTTCIDGDPPVEDNLQYRVFAWDSDPLDDSPRKSQAPSDTLVVRLGNKPPFPPANVKAVPQADGSVRLTWNRPSPEDPDSGDGIAFYRIYRDATAYDARYKTWVDPNGSAQFVDANTGGTAHTYWVRAVDKNYAESAPVQAVAP